MANGGGIDQQLNGANGPSDEVRHADLSGQGAIITYTGDEHAKVEDEARAYLAATAKLIGTAAVNTEIALRYGDAAAEISAAADEYSAAANVMATHCRARIVRAMLGSVAGGILHLTTSPVVLVHTSSLHTNEGPVAQR